MGGPSGSSRKEGAEDVWNDARQQEKFRGDSKVAMRSWVLYLIDSCYYICISIL